MTQDEARQMIDPGEKLRRARVVFGWSQAKTDEEAGVKPGRTFSYERRPPRSKPPRDYIERLAAKWDIDPEWFFNGVDDLPPVGENRPATTGQEVPVLGMIPTRDKTPAKTGTKSSKVDFRLPPGSGYRQISETCYEPYLIRGDWVLIVPAEFARNDVIGLIEGGDGWVDVADMQRIDGTVTPTPLTEYHNIKADGSRILGTAVEVQRRMASGLVVVFENEFGLSKDMLRLA